MARPSIKLNGVADTYAQREVERIAEIGNGKTGGPGGLLSLRRSDSGSLMVTVYRTDPGVSVVTGADVPTYVNGKKVNDLVTWWYGLPAEVREHIAAEHSGDGSGVPTWATE
jgi:hypothetical protein